MTWKKLTRDLTAYDVGKKVRLRNGDEDVIVDYRIYTTRYPIVTRCHIFTANGSFGLLSGITDVLDIVEIYEEAVEESDVTLNSPLDYYAAYSPQTNLTISIEDGTEVVKGRFKDSSGKKWYVTMERF